MKLDLRLGDCFELIKDLPNNSVDLVVTSPPYSDIVNYGSKVKNKNVNEYVEWILPLFSEIHRVLKPSGSFILNINDKCENGYRSTYIFDLICENNRRTNLKLYDTYFWHKKNGIPNGGNKRFRNMTEYIFHFCKDAKKMKFYMDRVLKEPSESYQERMKYEIGTQGEVVEGVRIKKKVQINDIGGKIRPDNVFRFSTAGASRDNTIKHPAPFNKELPIYFINLLTDSGDVVLDPFSGIGTTGVACSELDRDYIGFELNETYYDFSKKRISNNDLEEEWVVNQYDLDGNFIKSFKNRTSAGKELNLCSEDIMRCYARVGFNTCGGYIWKLEKK